MSDGLELRIKQVIVESLMLEDVKPDDIDTNAPLFVEGLGLDSIDALELAVALHSEFGVRTKADDERNRAIFHSVGSLAEFIRTEKTKAAAEPDAAPGASDQGAANQSAANQGTDGTPSA